MALRYFTKKFKRENPTVLPGDRGLRGFVRKARANANFTEAGVALGAKRGLKQTTRFGRITKVRFIKNGEAPFNMGRVAKKLNPTIVIQRVKQKAREMGAKTPRRFQLLAALTLPFFIVPAIVAGPAVLQAVVSLLPSGFVATEIVKFFLGLGIFIGVFAAAFAYVATGAFHFFE